MNQDQLYSIVKEFYKKYVDQDDNIIVILTADSSIPKLIARSVSHYTSTEGIGGNDVLGMKFP